MRTLKEKLKRVEASIAALLKLNGFKKDRLTWRRERNGVIHIVNIQLSQLNSKEKIKFYINLAIFNADFFEKKYGYKEKKPKEWQCQKSERIEIVKGLRKSFGFDITERTDEKEMALQLVTDLKIYALPWFDKE